MKEKGKMGKGKNGKQKKEKAEKEGKKEGKQETTGSIRKQQERERKREETNFAQAISVQTARCLSALPKVISLCVALLRLRKPDHGLQGWSVEDDLSKALWKRILVGPRRPSTRWPPAQRVPALNESLQQKKVSVKDRANSGLSRSLRLPQQPQETRSSPAESEAEAAAKLAKLELALSALDAESKCLKNLVDKTRVRAGHGHPGKRLDECQQYLLQAGKRSEMASCGRRCRRAGSVARRVQHWGREIGGVRHLTSGGDGQQHWHNPTPRSVGRRAPQREGRAAIKRSRVEASRGGWP